MQSDADDQRPTPALLTSGILAFVGLVLVSTPAGAVELFGPAALHFPPVGYVSSLRAADLDGDGALDIVAGANPLRVYFGDRDGGFAYELTSLPGGAQPRVGTADFDGDGAIDVAVFGVAFGRCFVKVLLNDGRGGLAESASLEVATCQASFDAPGGLVVADFDRDGSSDVAITVSDGERAPGGEGIAIVFGDGAGGLSPGAMLEGGSMATDLVAADLDGDGVLDLVVASGGSWMDRAPDRIDVLRGDGSGGFSEVCGVEVGDRPYSLAVVELTGDAIPDLAVAEYDPVRDVSETRILPGAATGCFGSAIVLPGTPIMSFPQRSASGALAVADVNGDGALDILAPNPSGSTLAALYLADGQGAFATKVVSVRGPYLVMDDFDADGVPDLAAGAYEGVTLLRGDGLGGFAQNDSLRFAAQAVAIADVDADGKPDVVTSTSGGVSVHIGDGAGAFSSQAALPVGINAGLLQVVDLDDDGDRDIVVGVWGFPPLQPGATTTIETFLNDGAGVFAASASFEVHTNVINLAVEHLDSDPYRDLILTVDDLVGDREVFAYLGDGLGGFSPRAAFPVGSSPSGLGVGDLNHDGRADVVVAALGRLHVLLGDGAGGFASSSEHAWEGVGLGGVELVDLDRDGNVDAAVTGWLPQTGEAPVARVRAFLGDGRGGFPRIVETDDVSPFPNYLAGADLNADGFPDLVTANNDASLTVLLGDGTGRFLRAVDLWFGFGTGVAQIVLGDLDGDGLPDLVLPQGSSVGIAKNLLAARADANGSDRIDGFDVAAVSRLAGSSSSDCAALATCSYTRTADVDLNGVIDGDDLALVAARFGKLRRAGSPLRGELTRAPSPTPGAVVMRQAATEGDLLTVEILADGAGQPAAGADFSVTFEPAPGDRRPGQVLEVAGFNPGTFLAGGAAQAYSVDTSTPGTARIRVTRLPNADQTTSGPEPLLSLYLRARREGEAALDFGPNGLSAPALLSASAHALTGIEFVGGAAATVTSSSGEATPGQRIGAGPSPLDLGVARVGGSNRKMLRVSNFGFSALRVTGVGATLAEFTTFFTSEFAVPPHGFVELPVVFTPTQTGLFSGELLLDSDDPRTPRYRAPLIGRTDRELQVTPERLEFGAVPVGNERALRLRLVHRGAQPLVLSGVQSTGGVFLIEPAFSTLEPGQAGEVVVRFRPVSEGEAEESLTLRFTGVGDRTVVVALRGN